MKLKLLVVTSTFPRWNNDIDPPFVFELSKRLTSYFDVSVHTPYYPGATVRDKIAGMDIFRFRYFIKPLNKLAGTSGILPTLLNNKLYYAVVPFFLFFQLISLLRVVKRIKPNVIHAHWLIPQGIAAVCIGKLFSIPVVVTAHGGDVFGLKGKFFDSIKSIVLKEAKAITTVSNALATNLSRLISRDYIEVISMGVDSTMFHPKCRDDRLKTKHKITGPFLLYVGRLTEKKGVRYLLEAMPNVFRLFPKAKLVIIGRGELENSLSLLSDNLGLSNNVEFINGLPQAELPAYYATADIFIGPSIMVSGGDSEGFGLTFVEAAMSGCIVIASNIGGIPDIILDGQTGYLVRPGDSVELATCISEVITGIDSKNQLTRQARKRCIEYFDWGTIANQYAVVISKLVNGKLVL